MRIAPAPRRLLAAALLAIGMAGTSGVGTAHAQTDAEKVVIEGDLAADGSLAVTQTITLPASGAPAELVVRLDTTRDNSDGSYDEHTITKVTATAGGVDLAPSVTTDGDEQVITVQTAKAAGKPLVIGYTVSGATRPVEANGETPAGVELNWPVLQGLSVGAKQVEGTVQTPAPITWVDCKSGPQGSLQPCATFSAGQFPDADPKFTETRRAPGDQVVLSFGQPKESVAVTEVVKQRWSLDRAFTVNPTTVLASLFPLLLGGLGLWVLHRRTGRDQVDPARITPVAEFRPVGVDESEFTVLDGVRPGHVGTVADEHVDPVDVTGTLLDLASRGWLRIVELPRDGEHKALDWAFERVEDGRDELRGFEKTLRDAVAPEDGPQVKVSTIAAAVGPVIGTVQDGLYDEVVERGWFERRPDQTRSKWTAIGWVALALAVVATLVLVLLTTFGLVGLALVGLVTGLLVVGQEMPRRTRSGAALLGGLAGLAAQLRTQPTHLLPKGRELEELSRVLPYAVVLGGKDRWLQALVDADTDETPDGDDLSWYKAPETWHLRDLPDSLNAFITTVQGHLFGRH